MAYFGAGLWSHLNLYMIRTDAEIFAAERIIFRDAAVSPSGQWVATPGGPQAPSGVIIRDMNSPKLLTASTNPQYQVYGMAFDQAGERLAVLELSAPDAEERGWAIMVVELASGSVTRFTGGSWDGEEAMLPGYPLGWTASGDELLIDTFLPFTESGTMGVRALSLPPGTEAATIATLDTRQILDADDYQTRPRLSPDGSRLLYLGRNPDYTPDDYEPVAYDVAVNQLWGVDLTAEEAQPTPWLTVEDGGALARHTDWSPDGSRALIAEGSYAGDAFALLVLKTHDGDAVVDEIGDVPLSEGGSLVGLDWCHPATVLVTIAGPQGDHELYIVNTVDGAGTRIEDSEAIDVIGCVNKGATTMP
jgi:hypothetical protein